MTVDVLQNMSREELCAALARLDDKCRALAQERDAAVKAREEERAALNRAISLRDDKIKALCKVRDEAEAERDAARAEVERLSAILLDGARTLPFDREQGGRFVREAWVRWAKTQPNPKPSWLLPYDELSEPDKEADRIIGEALGRWTLLLDAARAALAAKGEA